MLKYLVYYCCIMINIIPKTNSVGGISKRKIFTGVKVDYKRDCKVDFGEYVQIYLEDEVTNTLR